MKGFFFICFFLSRAMLCQAQGRATLASINTGIDRIAMAKSSIDVPAWHERDFWPLYEKYLDEEQEISSNTYRALQDIAATVKTTRNEEALDNAQRLIGKRYDELTIRKRYFLEIGSALN